MFRCFKPYQYYFVFATQLHEVVFIGFEYATCMSSLELVSVAAQPIFV